MCVAVALVGQGESPRRVLQGGGAQEGREDARGGGRGGRYRRAPRPSALIITESQIMCVCVVSTQIERANLQAKAKEVRQRRAQCSLHGLRRVLCVCMHRFMGNFGLNILPLFGQAVHSGRMAGR